jgi:hypothetical protein
VGAERGGGGSEAVDSEPGTSKDGDSQLVKQLAVYGVTLDSLNQGGYCYAHLESKEATVMLIWKAAGSVRRNFGLPEPGRLLLCSLEK